MVVAGTSWRGGRGLPCVCVAFHRYTQTKNRKHAHSVHEEQVHEIEKKDRTKSPVVGDQSTTVRDSNRYNCVINS